MADRRASARLRRRVAVEMICPYEPGKPIDTVRRELGLRKVIKLASNENPLGPSPRVIERLNRTNLRLNQYPDYDGVHLRETIGARLGLPASRLVLGAGSAEIVRLSALAYLERGDEAVMADACFPVYADATRLAGATVVPVPLDDRLDHDLERMLRAIKRRTRVVYLASPNNPTGRMIPRPDVVRFLEKLPARVLCVLDLAYHEYCLDAPGVDPMRLLDRFPNLLVLRTFSKVFGLAGLRIGYAAAGEDIIESLGRVRTPFNTSTAAQLAARVALDDGEHVARSVALNRESRAALTRGLEALGLRVWRSDANFVLVDAGRDAETVFQQLLVRGVIVRPVRNPRLATCLRVTTGTPAQQRVALGVLEEVLRAVPARATGPGNGQRRHARA